jgi:hypothetical protein
MFAPLLGAIRADIDRQVGWAKDEVRRQTRYATLTGVLAGMAALAALTAIIGGLVALYLWLVMQTDPFIALAMNGGGLLLLAVLLFALAFMRRRPRLAVRPQLQIAPAGGSARDAQAGQLQQDRRRRRADTEACHRDAASMGPDRHCWGRSCLWPLSG